MFIVYITNSSVNLKQEKGCIDENVFAESLIN